nr:MAG TPA: hypothetical protein [Caudoviricetes sp.]
MKSWNIKKLERQSERNRQERGAKNDYSKI